MMPAQPDTLPPAQAHARRPHRARTFWGLVLLAGLALPYLAYWWVDSLATERLRAAGAQRLEVYATSLENLLDKYDFVPRMLELDKDVVALLERPGDEALRNGVNEYLEGINRQAGSSTIYVVNLLGRTQAASNWRQKDSFVGDDVGFRPYLKDALRGQPGGFYGVGTTNGEPGYFYAHGIYKNGRMLGVAVVKVNIEELEKNWAQGADKVMLVDANGVIFLTSARAWKYKTLRPLAADVRAQLEHTRQYHRQPLTALTLASDQPQANGTRLLAIRDTGAGLAAAPPRMLAQTRSLAPRDWTFIYLSDLSQARGNARVAFLFALLAYGFLLLLFLLWRQRLRAKEDLQHAYDDLERMVDERTASLARMTQDLSKEVDVRREAEQRLHITQNELFQAGKMAVLGQMSASITHELNQPLTALRTMSDNAVLLFDRGRMDDVKHNLKTISQVVARMGSITGKLKSFARKSNAELEAVSVHTAISNALVLVERRLQLDKVTFQLRIAEADIYALCDSNRLEQVLLNLMTNALDSMAGCPVRRLGLEVTGADGQVRIGVSDSGPGLTDEARARLFEPFYTTKPQGEGLGLGLAISEQIVRDFGGTLRAEQCETGACFVIELKAAQET
ncbi:sensor histidine kinase [Pseudoduganella namucuonensis]|uniref:C4-dicarboxylate transport sensor protein DctB n=1 Tax=Pseudoduganella namucuonensis TaxID=1035707 RepID=A0A1I7JPM2_9BURK|nr:ATP-binding protein [Pseudoduganella namucuonensis]SFU87098.1 two-component system, NtrC family, C4-dicarboxylate transport sensor histidine kinase DctB [Pseudoduganella namucuonensis]